MAILALRRLRAVDVAAGRPLNEDFEKAKRENRHHALLPDPELLRQALHRPLLWVLQVQRLQALLGGLRQARCWARVGRRAPREVVRVPAQHPVPSVRPLHGGSPPGRPPPPRPRAPAPAAPAPLMSLRAGA